MDELMEIGLDEIMVKILEKELIDFSMQEIGLITAQLEVLDVMLIKYREMIEDALESKLDSLKDDLIYRRELILQDETKKRMVNARIAWTAFNGDSIR